MCIIVYKPKGLPVDRRTLETCFINNPDGTGFMFPCENRLLIKKGYFEFDDFWPVWEKCWKIHGDSIPVVFHFRIATAGEIDKTNCHPHRITHELGFVHNGILSCVKVAKGSKISDTIIYRNRYLDSLTGKSLRNVKLFRAIGRHIGAGNKFVFMNGAGDVTLCNEDQGVWKDGLWYSNSSFLPRNPFVFLADGAFCEYCGKILNTAEEFVENVCLDCLDYFEADYAECGGCHRMLPTGSYRAVGWCDDCGYEIYGRKWPQILREAANESRKCYPEWF